MSFRSRKCGKRSTSLAATASVRDECVCKTPCAEHSALAAFVTRTYLYGPAVCCKPDVSDGGIGLALLYPARE